MSKFNPTPKDWPEDFPHENGNYLCVCHTCASQFTGYKRRVTCKECATARMEVTMTPENNPASDTAMEAAELEAPAWFWKYLADPNSAHAERMKKLLDDSTAALRREVEELRAERDAAKESLQIRNAANETLRTDRDAALQQVAELTRERDALIAAFNAIGDAIGPITLEAVSLVMTPTERAVASIEQIKAERDAALARAEEGEKDTARLDYLESRCFTNRENERELHFDFSGTLRFAIDAATGGTKAKPTGQHGPAFPPNKCGPSFQL